MPQNAILPPPSPPKKNLRIFHAAKFLCNKVVGNYIHAKFIHTGHWQKNNMA